MLTTRSHNSAWPGMLPLPGRYTTGRRTGSIRRIFTTNHSVGQYWPTEYWTPCHKGAIDRRIVWVECPEKLFKTYDRRTSAKRNVASSHPKEAKNPLIFHPCFNGRCSFWVDFLRHVGQPGWGPFCLYWVGVSNVLVLLVSVAHFIPILGFVVLGCHASSLMSAGTCCAHASALQLHCPILGCRRMVDQCLMESFQLLPKVAQLLRARAGL